MNFLIRFPCTPCYKPIFLIFPWFLPLTWSCLALILSYFLSLSKTDFGFPAIKVLRGFLLVSLRFIIRMVQVDCSRRLLVFLGSRLGVRLWWTMWGLLRTNRSLRTYTEISVHIATAQTHSCEGLVLAVVISRLPLLRIGLRRQAFFDFLLAFSVLIVNLREFLHSLLAHIMERLLLVSHDSVRRD